jgi:hypothetical protein
MSIAGSKWLGPDQNSISGSFLDWKMLILEKTWPERTAELRGL